MTVRFRSANIRLINRRTCLLPCCLHYILHWWHKPRHGSLKTNTCCAMTAISVAAKYSVFSSFSDRNELESRACQHKQLIGAT